MSSARENIMARLRAADPARDFVPSDFAVLDEKQWSQEEKLARYRGVTEAVNTEVHTATQTTWAQRVCDILKTKNVSSLAYGMQTWAEADLLKAFDTDSAAPTLVPYDTTIENFKTELFENIGAGLTTARGAIAETGTLIVWPTPEEPRLLSLVPPIHVALVFEDTFYNTFHEAMAEQNWTDGMPTNALLISGPSKTADIEQELCYGVHGPRELVVVLIKR